jgi:hypothetical protein
VDVRGLDAWRARVAAKVHEGDPTTCVLKEYRVRAALVEHVGDKVRLKTEAGLIVNEPFENLCTLDRFYVWEQTDRRLSSIPDAGGGLSGFAAYVLWHIYVFFPFAGTWDWVLLLFLLAVLNRIGYLPYVWNAVRADMAALKTGEWRFPGWNMWFALWDLLTFVVLAWFLFQTSAGRTLLQNRVWLTRSASDPDAITLTVSFVLHLALFGFMIYVAVDPAVRKTKPFLSQEKSCPFPDRRPLSLWLGGGAFAMRNANGTTVESGGAPLYLFMFLLEMSAFNFIALCMLSEEGNPAFRSSARGAVWMLMFTIGALLLEAARMGFVWCQHKRTFGQNVEPARATDP